MLATKLRYLAASFLGTGLMVAALLAVDFIQLFEDAEYRVTASYCLLPEKMPDEVELLEDVVSRLGGQVSIVEASSDQSVCDRHESRLPFLTETVFQGDRSEFRTLLTQSGRVFHEGVWVPRVGFEYTVSYFREDFRSDKSVYSFLSIPAALLILFFFRRKLALVTAEGKRGSRGSDWFLALAGTVAVFFVVWVAIVAAQVAGMFRVNVVEPGLTAVVVVYAIVAAPVVEEVIFRYWLLGRLTRVLPAGLALALSTAAFTTFHAPNSAHQIFALVVSGGFFGWIYLRSRVIWVPIAAHAVWNVLAVALVESARFTAAA